jgi:phospho-N-acetylmuramoyl-pentapeptide-transferase
MAILTSLLIALFFGKYFIVKLQKMQIGESVRDLGLQGQLEKQGTPTMGGLIILVCILVPSLLFARPENVYVLLLMVSTIWMGAIGFLDDYIKVFRKNKEGLQGKFKVVGQIGLGLIVGLTLYYNSNVTVREYHQTIEDKTTHVKTEITELNETTEDYIDEKSSITTIPFMKDNELDYNKLSEWIGFDVTPLLYVLIVVFIITAVSNGANITDGIDGLTAGTSAIIGATLLILAYVSGHAVFADYLNIMYIPSSGEIVVFTAAFVGACLGFLWFNSFPAQVFMGDTGSLSIGGIIAVIALSIRKELLIPILCGIFLIENISVILQVSYFKYTKKKYGEGRRIFKMAPLHHHYQKDNVHEAKIVTRFWLVGIILSILTLATLKLR